MSGAAGTTFSCGSCGKKFVWKPELAGKKVRCKCGQAIPVPASTVPWASAAAAPSPVAAVAPVARPRVSAPAAVRSPVAVAPPVALDNDDPYDLAESAAPSPVRPVAQGSVAAAVAPPMAVPGMEDDAYRCPSCSEAMEAGAIICSSCGFNLKTGERVNLKRATTTAGAGTAKKAASKMPAGSAFAGIPTRSKPKFVEDKKGQLVKMLVPIVLVVVLIGAFALFKFVASRTGGGPSHKFTDKGDDPEVARKMDDEYYKEIHEWFKQDPGRMTGELSRSQAEAKADELKQMGAKTVYAFSPRMSLCLAVELPDDPEQRKALFAFENKWALQHRYKPRKDEGQKFILLNLNP